MPCGKPFVAAALLAMGGLSAATGNADGEFARIEAIADETAARAAVRAVSSSDLLARIAKKSKSWRLRADATYFITEEAILRDIFANDPDWHVKSAALFGMVDGTFLKNVACDENGDDRVRAVAVSKLRDRTLLESLKSSPNATVRRFAAKQLPPEFKEAEEVPIPEATFTDVNSITRKTM